MINDDVFFGTADVNCRRMTPEAVDYILKNRSIEFKAVHAATKPDVIARLLGYTERGSVISEAKPDEWTYFCAFCTKKHDKRTLSINLSKGKFQCFACKTRGSMLDLVRYSQGKDENGEWACEVREAAAFLYGCFIEKSGISEDEEYAKSLDLNTSRLGPTYRARCYAKWEEGADEFVETLERHRLEVEAEERENETVALPEVKELPVDAEQMLLMLTESEAALQSALSKVQIAKALCQAQ